MNIALHQIKKVGFRTRGLTMMLLFSLPLGMEGFTNALLALCFMHGLFTFKHWQWRQALQCPLVWAGLLFFSWHALSLFWSGYPGDGMRQLESKGSFLFFPLLITAQRKVWNFKEWRAGVMAFMVGNVAVLLLALLQSTYKVIIANSLMLPSPGGTYLRFAYTYEELAAPFMHPGYLALHLGMALIAGMVMWEQKLWPGSKLWRYFTMGFLFLGLFLVQGRAALLAFLFIAGLAWAVRLFGKRGWRGLYWLLPPAGIVLLLVLVAPSPVQDRYLAFPDFDYDISGSNFNTATYRLAEWQGALNAIAKSPWWGHGVGNNWPVLKESYGELQFWQGIKLEYNAHNQYLETALIGGFIGLLCLLLWMGAYLKRAGQLPQRALLLTVLFFGLTILTESMLERAWAIILVNVWWPFLAAQPRLDHSSEPQIKGRKRN